MLRVILSVLLVAVALPAAAQESSDWRFGGDAYLAGRNVTLTGEPVRDLFIAGDKVTARADVNGSAHMAGRYVTLDARVGQNFYGAGMEVDLGGTVAGNATVAGDTVRVSEPVAGNIRATGSDVEVTAPVAGTAILAGENVSLDAQIGGDLALATANVDWGDNAQVAGTLHVYADSPDAIEVPERVAPADRVVFHDASEFQSFDTMDEESPGFFSRLSSWIGGVLVVGLLGTIYGAVAPHQLSRLREAALNRPLRTLLLGFVGMSALVGSVLFLALTGIGIVLIPVSVIAAILLGVVGYIVGTYAIGVWATGVAGRGAPSTTGDRAVAAFTGAVIGALVGLIPWLGWLAAMAIFLVGAGAIVIRMTRPAFGVDEAA